MEPPPSEWNKAKAKLRVYLASFAVRTVRDRLPWLPETGAEILDYLDARGPRRAPFLQLLLDEELYDNTFDVRLLLEEAKRVFPSRPTSPLSRTPPATELAANRQRSVPGQSPGSISEIPPQEPLATSDRDAPQAPRPSSAEPPGQRLRLDKEPAAPILTDVRTVPEREAVAAYESLKLLEFASKLQFAVVSGALHVERAAAGAVADPDDATLLANLLKFVLLTEAGRTPKLCSSTMFRTAENVSKELAASALLHSSALGDVLIAALNKVGEFVSHDTLAGLFAVTQQYSDADFEVFRDVREAIALLVSKWDCIISTSLLAALEDELPRLLARDFNFLVHVQGPVPRQPPRIVKLLGWDAEQTKAIYHREALTYISELVGRKKLNCLSVVGPSRQGKSFLLSSLLHHLNVPLRFTSSTEMEGTTVGGDMASEPISSPELGFQETDCAGLILLDVEGIGHKDNETISRLLLPAMMLSQVVIFNVRDPLRETLLSDLSIFATIVRSVHGRTNEKVFGHLAIVVRDWAPQKGNPSHLLNYLLKEEPETTKPATDRNTRRRVIIDAFSTPSIHCLPTPCDSMGQLALSEVPWQAVSAEYLQGVAKLLADLKKHFNCQVPFHKTALTGDTIAPLCNDLVTASNANSVNLGSLVTTLQQLECRSARDRAVASYQNTVREQYRTAEPRKPANLSAALERLLSATLREFSAAVEHLDRAIVEPHVESIRSDCKILGGDAMGENARKIADGCAKVVTECVTRILRTEFMAAQPRPLEVLIDVAKKDIKAKWPEYADEVTLRKKMDFVAEELSREYKPPTPQQIRKIMEHITSLGLGGRIREANDTLNVWLKWILQSPPEVLKSYAVWLHPIQANLAGPLLERIYTVKKEVIWSDPSLICEYGHYCSNSAQWELAEELYMRSLEVSLETNHDLVGAYCAVAGYWMQRKMPAKAKPFYEDAIKVTPQRGAAPLYLYPRCLKKLKQLDQAKEQAERTMQIAQKISDVVYVETVLHLSRNKILDPERTSSLLLALAGKEKAPGAVWVALLDLAIRQNQPDRAKTYVAHIQQAIPSLPHVFRQMVYAQLGQYYWQVATPPDFDLAEKCFVESAQRAPGFTSLMVLHKFYSSTGNVAKAEEVISGLIR